VDDCSTDRTYDVVRRFIENRPTYQIRKNPVNMGKGASVKAGMSVAKGACRLFTDADLSTPIEEVGRLLELLVNADMVIGSRRVKGAKVALRQPALRELAGRIFSVIVRVLTLKGFIDTQCGFKLFTALAAEKIFPRQTINGFGFDVELIYIAVRRLGLRVIEAPVTWFDSPQTKVRVLRDSTRMFLDLFTIRLNDLTGRYK
jgi:dolichyl-phosphate beta-glucosyltransferase